MAQERWAPSLDDFAAIAAVVLDTTPDAILRLPGIAQAESALHAPFASFSGQEAYANVTDQAAVLIAHLIGNHPLPDGNKRTAWLITARFLHANGRTWLPQDVDTDAGMIERIAAGQADHAQIADWITTRTTT